VLDFRAAVEAGDPELMERCLAPDVRFSSPVVYRPYEGREAVMAVLRAVFDVFEDFAYTDELGGDGVHGLVFSARVGDRELQGWDYLRLDDAGRVAELTVMVRPMSGMHALAEAMAAKLAPEAAAS
jgi:hypothetical protein